MKISAFRSTCAKCDPTSNESRARAEENQARARNLDAKARVEAAEAERARVRAREIELTANANSKHTPHRYLHQFEAELKLALNAINAAPGDPTTQIKTAMQRSGIPVADPDLRTFTTLVKRWVPRGEQVFAVYVQHRRSDRSPPLWKGDSPTPARTQVLHIVLTRKGYAYRSKINREPVEDAWVDGLLEYHPAERWPAYLVDLTLVPIESLQPRHGVSSTEPCGGFDLGRPALSQPSYLNARDGIPIYFDVCTHLALFTFWLATTNPDEVSLALGQGASPSASTNRTEPPIQPGRDVNPAEQGSLELINSLALLHAQGILTDEEFEAKKADVLRRI